MQCISVCVGKNRLHFSSRRDIAVRTGCEKSYLYEHPSIAYITSTTMPLNPVYVGCSLGVGTESLTVHCVRIHAANMPGQGSLRIISLLFKLTLPAPQHQNTFWTLEPFVSILS